MENTIEVKQEYNDIFDKFTCRISRGVLAPGLTAHELDRDTADATMKKNTAMRDQTTYSGPAPAPCCASPPPTFRLRALADGTQPGSRRSPAPQNRAVAFRAVKLDHGFLSLSLGPVGASAGRSHEGNQSDDQILHRQVHQ